MDGKSKRLSGDLLDICDGMKERATDAYGVLRTLRNLYSEALRKARIVENDRIAQKHYRKLYDAGKLPEP